MQKQLKIKHSRLRLKVHSKFSMLLNSFMPSAFTDDWPTKNRNPTSNSPNHQTSEHADKAVTSKVAMDRGKAERVFCAPWLLDLFHCYRLEISFA